MYASYVSYAARRDNNIIVERLQRRRIVSGNIPIRTKRKMFGDIKMDFQADTNDLLVIRFKKRLMRLYYIWRRYRSVGRVVFSGMA